MMDDPFGRLRLALIGMRVSHIWQGHGSAVFMEFGKLSPRQRRNGTDGNLWGEISVGLEFHWRLELGRAIVCGSAGDREIWEANFNLLHGAAVTDLALNGVVPELCLELSTGHRLITCSLYEDGPDWALTDRRHPVARWISFEDGHIVESDGLTPATRKTS